MRYHINKKVLSLLIIVLLAQGTNAQTHRIDSLRERLLYASNSEEQKKIVMGICERTYSLSADSLFKYISLGFKFFPPGSRDHVRMKNFYCVYLFKLGKIQEGLTSCDSLIQNSVDIKNIDRVGMDILATRCSGLIRNGQNKAAIEQAFAMLQYAEPIKDTLGIMTAYNLIGWSNMELEQYRDATRWFNVALSYANEETMIGRGGVICANNASCYNNINKPDSAFYFIALALKYCRLGENLTGLANSLNIRADMFINKKDYVNAEKDMKEALVVREQIADPMYTTSDMAQLSSFYASTGQTNKGIAIAQEGIVLARKAHNLSKIIFLYNALAENYKKANQQDNYAASLEVILRLKDSLYEENSEKAIAELGTKYELQKKENIIMRQDYQITRSRYTTLGASILFVLALLFVWVLYRNYRLIQQRKMETAMAEQKILSYKAVEQAEENERKRIAADLHDNLGSFAAAITANVKNLKDGNEASADAILSQLDENAQSMVTQLGDTIWVLKNEHLPITKLADRFKVWLQRLLQNYPQVKYYNSEDIVDDIEFSPSKILHIFLILKECINNALKHSNCTDLKINFKSDKGWVISIEDNGVGFDNTAIPKRSGLDNIKKRAAECGWNVEWEKANPFGTRVVISGTTTN